MAEPLETRLFIHRLTDAEKTAVYAHDRAFPSAGLAASFAVAIEDVCIDKLIRADGCLRLAQSLALDADHESQRAAIGRAYYSIHHCLRAIVLRQDQWDPDGHEKTIEKFRELLKDNAFRNRSGLPENTGDRVTEARRNRHVADYSPYDSQRTYDAQRNSPNTGLEGITNGSWSEAVQFNTSLAEEIFVAAIKCVGL